jgi:lysophospholipid acyltransferase (LPLAT)-like uncharacterized protein
MIPAVPDAKPRAKRQSGIVVPHTLNWWRRALVWIIAAVIRIIASTLRWRWEFHPALTANRNRPVIFCTWHNRVVLSPMIYRGYIRHIQQTPRLAAVVSASRDGAIIAGVLQSFDIQCVRGSSSRRGSQALLELITAIGAGHDLAVTPDGPRGPRYTAQAGAIALAQLTGKPLIPAACNVRWKICLKSWDRFQIPLPFSSVTMRFGQPMTVAPESEREELRAELQRRMDALTED